MQLENVTTDNQSYLNAEEQKINASLRSAVDHSDSIKDMRLRQWFKPLTRMSEIFHMYMYLIAAFYKVCKLPQTKTPLVMIDNTSHAAEWTNTIQ